MLSGHYLCSLILERDWQFKWTWRMRTPFKGTLTQICCFPFLGLIFGFVWWKLLFLNNILFTNLKQSMLNNCCVLLCRLFMLCCLLYGPYCHSAFKHNTVWIVSSILSLDIYFIILLLIFLSKKVKHNNIENNCQIYFLALFTASFNDAMYDVIALDLCCYSISPHHDLDPHIWIYETKHLFGSFVSVEPYP